MSLDLISNVQTYMDVNETYLVGLVCTDCPTLSIWAKASKEFLDSSIWHGRDSFHNPALPINFRPLIPARPHNNIISSGSFLILCYADYPRVCSYRFATLASIFFDQRARSVVAVPDAVLSPTPYFTTLFKSLPREGFGIRVRLCMI